MGRKASVSLLSALLEKKNADNVLTWYSNCAGSQVRALFLATFPLRAQPCFRKKKKRSESTSTQENYWNAHPVKKKMPELCVSTSLSPGIGPTGLRPP